MFRLRHLNAPCPIILRTRGDGTLAAACMVADTPSIRSTHQQRRAAAMTARTPLDFPAISAPKETKPMKPGLRPGVSRVNRITIGPERTISFMGDEARTYATPTMIRDIEYTCRDLILEHADPGEDSVGMEVAVKHLAPTLLGMTVE